MVELSRIVDAARRAHGPALMGVLNLTPDSFFDGGAYIGARAAEERIDTLLSEGADIIDIGGESSRPGAAPVAPREQIERVEAALSCAVARGAFVSIDTTSPEVAEFALGRGARAVNDVSCLADRGLAEVAARHGAALVITHSRGAMAHMPGFSQWPDRDYADVVEDSLRELEAARERAVFAGLPREDVLFDPGLGFSKNARHSFELLQRLAEFQRAGALVVVGPGRKSFIGSLDESPPERRLGGTIAACLIAANQGADILRVHDVQAVRQALLVARAARPAAARWEGDARV